MSADENKILIRVYLRSSAADHFFFTAPESEGMLKAPQRAGIWQ
jgi:hypothetical protein